MVPINPSHLQNSVVQRVSLHRFGIIRCITHLHIISQSPSTPPSNTPSSFHLRPATPIHLRPAISIELPLLLSAFFQDISLFQDRRRCQFITPVDPGFLISLGTSFPVKKEAKQDYYSQAYDGGRETDSGLATGTKRAGGGMCWGGRWCRNGC